MTPVREWPKGLGLGRYAAAFEENEIDPEALPHLTEPMPGNFGPPIGPRAPLLAAVAALQGATGADAEETGAAEAAPAF